MTLTFLVANQAWVFVFGDQIVQMGDSSRFHMDRGEAVAAAAECGLTVDARGVVASAVAA